MLQVALPHVGTFLRLRGSRISFIFDPVLTAHFESGAPAATAAPTPVPAGYAVAPPLGNRPGSTAAVFATRPLSTAERAAAIPTSRPASAFPPPVATPSFLHQADVPQGLRQLHALCVEADPARLGCVKRLQMERWLNRECRQLVGQLSAATVLDLLQANAHGALCMFG